MQKARAELAAEVELASLLLQSPEAGVQREEAFGRGDPFRDASEEYFNEVSDWLVTDLYGMTSLSPVQPSDEFVRKPAETSSLEAQET